MDDIGFRSLDWLYKQQTKARIALERAESKYDRTCADCVEIKNLKGKLEIIDWLIGAATKAV